MNSRVFRSSLQENTDGVIHVKAKINRCARNELIKLPQKYVLLDVSEEACHMLITQVWVKLGIAAEV